MTLLFSPRSTLNRWACKLSVESGVMQSFLQLLHHKVQSMTELERVCILSFDESSVYSEWSNDRATDMLCDSKDRVECAMMRGLVSPCNSLLTMIITLP